MEHYDPAAVARRFPFFAARPELTYLDSAATTQRLDTAIERISRFYGEENASVHRGFYGPAAAATEAYEGARQAVARYINAAEAGEIIFLRGTTEAINLAAHCWSRAFLSPGDRILATAMEHHSNFLPWQRAAAERSGEFCVCAIGKDGELDLEDFEKKLTDRTRLVAITHASNVLGTINAVKDLVRLAHQAGAAVLVDGAKWMDFGPVDVADLGCDFYAFSGHKMFAGNGIGVLYGRKNLLESMAPYQLGGGMVEEVTDGDFRCRQLPEKFEAGTPNVAGALGLHCAVEFLSTFPWPAYHAHCGRMGAYLRSALGEIPDLRLLGSAANRVAVYSMVHCHVHCHDLATALASKNICVRAGNHCAQPLCRALAIPASLRASFSIYSGMAEAEKFVEGLRWAIRVLS